jgi:ubiquitin-like protein Pup
MGEQVQVRAENTRTVSHEEAREMQDEAVVNSAKDIGKAALKAELDELLDDIDEVLVDNAEAFVNAFIQQSGE